MLNKFLASAALIALSGGAAHAEQYMRGGPMTSNSPIGELPQARAGQCFARIITPAQYEKVPTVVTTQEGYQTLHAVEPEFRDSSVEIMVKEAGVEYRVRQPRYEARTEQVLVKPGFERLQVVPAQYETITEEIVIGERRYVWKPGANLSNTKRVDPRTGQVYCLVEVPPKTKTVTKKVMVQPEQVKRVAIDPEYVNVTKQVLVDRGGVEEIPLPPEYRTVPTQELVSAATTETRQHAPTTATVEKLVLRAPEKYEWVEVLCDVNADETSISAVQQALKDRGYYNIRVDGIMGPRTEEAIRAFQSDNGIPHQGFLSIETLRALGLAGPVSTHSQEPKPMMQPKPMKDGVGLSTEPVPLRVPEGAARAPLSPPQTAMAPMTPVQPQMAQPQDHAAAVMMESAPENSVMMQAEIVPEAAEGRIEYIEPTDLPPGVGEAVSSEPRPVERPREYSVRNRKRLDWDGR